MILDSKWWNTSQLQSERTCLLRSRWSWCLNNWMESWRAFLRCRRSVLYRPRNDTIICSSLKSISSLQLCWPWTSASPNQPITWTSFLPLKVTQHWGSLKGIDSPLNSARMPVHRDTDSDSYHNGEAAALLCPKWITCSDGRVFVAVKTNATKTDLNGCKEFTLSFCIS